MDILTDKILSAREREEWAMLTRLLNRKPRSMLPGSKGEARLRELRNKITSRGGGQNGRTEGDPETETQTSGSREARE